MASKGSPKERISRLFKKSRSGSNRNGEVYDTSPSPDSSPDLTHATNGRQSTSSHDPQPAHDVRRKSQNRKSTGGLIQSQPYQAQDAAAKAPGTEQHLPRIRHNTDLSHDLANLTFDTQLNEGRHSVNIADRNIAGDPIANSPPLHSKPGNGNLRASPVELERSSRPQSFPPAVATEQARQNDGTEASHDSQRSGSAMVTSSNIRENNGRSPEDIPRSSLDKPLPATPAPQSNQSTLGDNANILDDKRDYLVKDAASPPDLTGIVDLTDTVDTTVDERWAPAVTHNTVIQDVHHIREEQITREIHTHDIYHRILPIIDIEVKPARHFIPVQGGYAEVAADELPGRTGDNANWVIAELASKGLPKSQQAAGPRKFTARKFEGTEGDFQEYKAPEGHPVTEQAWVHPPTVEDGGRQTGQTYPFHFGCEDPKDDGLRATLPEGVVIGTSELYARQQREQEHKALEEKDAGEQSEYKLPPVPPHRQLTADWDDARNGSSGVPSNGGALSPRFL